MRFATLGSGSQGNALLVEAGRTRVLLDCGFGLEETAARLAQVGLMPNDVDAILITHEHSDHIGGAARFAAKHHLPVWLTYGTFTAHASEWPDRGIRVNLIDAHTPFAIGDMEILPFPVPHDAREPAQYVFGDGAVRLGVLTDVGRSTRHIERMLDGCSAIVLECNHDVEMLHSGPYPWGLKRRVAGHFGHLDNAAAAALLKMLDTTRLQHIIAAHLSEQNNTPALAQHALGGALNCTPDWVGIAPQHSSLAWREIV